MNRNSGFVLIYVAGSCRILVDDGRENLKRYSLCQPHVGIYLPTSIWREMYEFSPNSVLPCLSNRHYDTNDYIRDYDVFLSHIHQNE